MSLQAKKSFGTSATHEEGTGGLPAALSALSAEVVDLLHAQTFSAGEYVTEAAVCHAFSEILLGHWDLCCLATFLCNDQEQLQVSAMHLHPHMDEDAARRAAMLMAREVEQRGEWQVWLDEFETPDVEATDDEAEFDETADVEMISAETRAVFAAAGFKAGVALPIYARGSLVGAIVALSPEPARLRAAVSGLRFIAAPIVIALGNARRTAALRAQHAEIERLVAELRERSEALEVANCELQRVARYRSLFLARMSHELRTPLTSMLGFSEILLEHEHLTPAQHSFCEKIQSSGLHLQTSVQHLVDLSRLEAGQTELFLHEFSVRETLRETCGAVARLAQKKGVKLDCQIAPDCGTVVSDEGKLRQVLYNFFAHAIARSPEGQTVSITASAPTPAELSIEIRDEGPPPAAAGHNFEAVDVDASNERGTNMNELGLVIAYRLVGVLNGRVSLEPVAPHGLLVRLELPAYPSHE